LHFGNIHSSLLLALNSAHTKTNKYLKKIQSRLCTSISNQLYGKISTSKDFKNWICKKHWEKNCFNETNFMHPAPFRFLSNQHHLQKNIICTLKHMILGSKDRATSELKDKCACISLKIWNLFWSNSTKVMKITNRKMKIRLKFDKRRKVGGDSTLSKRPERASVLNATWRLARQTEWSECVLHVKVLTKS